MTANLDCDVEIERMESAPEDLDPGLWQHLPDEVLEQVLPRLPLEAIFRFRAVCKRWHQLPLSPAFRDACKPHSTGSQTPQLLVAMRSVDDLRLTPVLTSHGKKWQALGLTFLHHALQLEHCDRITAIASDDSGLLCVSALNTISRSVIVVCNPLTESWKVLPAINNPLTVVFRQVVIRVEKPCGHYRVFCFGQDLHGRRRAMFLYNSRSDCVVPLPRVTDSLAHTCGAFREGIYYTLSREYELIGFDTDSPNWSEVNTGVTMADQADGCKMLAHHDGRLFCAIAKEGNPNSRDDVVEFRIYEMNLATRQCVRVNVGLQCLFVNDSPWSSADSRYDWDFVAHSNSLLLVARSRTEDPRNTRWLEVHVHGTHRLPSLATAFNSPGEKWRLMDKFGSRSLLLSSLSLDLNQEVQFA